MSVSTDEQPVDVVSAGESPAPTAPEEYVPPVQQAAAPEAESSLQAFPARDESERLDPDPTPLVLISGTPFDLEALKLRQFLRLLRIVTRGASDVLDTADLNFDDSAQFIQTFVGMVLFSVPEAEEETIDFLKSMVKPQNLTGNPDKDLIKVQELSAELDNPELEDTVTIIQCVIEREAEDLRALGKRLGAMFKVAEKMGATSGTPKN